VYGRLYPGIDLPPDAVWAAGYLIEIGVAVAAAFVWTRWAGHADRWLTAGVLVALIVLFVNYPTIHKYGALRLAAPALVIAAGFASLGGGRGRTGVRPGSDPGDARWWWLAWTVLACALVFPAHASALRFLGFSVLNAH